MYFFCLLEISDTTCILFIFFLLLRFTFLRQSDPHPLGTLCFYYSVFPGSGPEWCWLSVTCNFVISGKCDRFACSVFPFVTAVASYAFQLAGPSVVRLVYQWQKGNVMLPSLGWLRVASQGSATHLELKLSGSVISLNGGDIITTKTSLMQLCNFVVLCEDEQHECCGEMAPLVIDAVWTVTLMEWEAWIPLCRPFGWLCVSARRR